MRKRFEEQFSIDGISIKEIKVPIKCRDAAAKIVAALKELYLNTTYRDKILDILEAHILKGKKNTGRKGMNLWQIFVLAQFRMTLNISYDRLHYMSNYDTLLRQLMGIETKTGFDRLELDYQRIVDNVSLLDDKMVRQINEIIVEMGHEVFKKKEEASLRLKTDSFVVENNVHFPTDYNLLWDSSRKSLDIVKKFKKKYPHLLGWRKIKDWYKAAKNLSRSLGRASASGGKNKEKRIKVAASKYLVKITALEKKLNTSVGQMPVCDSIDLLRVVQLQDFINLVNKHIDLVDRRLLKAEKIPHEEKLFSIFEQYTEWITKGKLRPNVELGKKVAITTDQYHLIVDYKIMGKESDSMIVKDLANRVLEKWQVYSWSFDKGFWHKDNKAHLQKDVEQVIMPKKGKPNKEEQEHQSEKEFKKLRNKHSAVESNINELEHRGLNRCPDRGYANFKRYVGLSITAYNLHKIGKELIKQQQKKSKKRLRIAA